MTIEEKERLFIEAHSFDKLSYDEFASKYDIERAEVSILYDRTKKTTSYIQKIRDKYNSILNRSKSDFADFKEFYYWFEQQPKQCYYCGIKQNDLKKLFDDKIIESKKFTSTLHIERFDNKKSYSKSNCALACAICNNAKSDMITKDDFEKFFVPMMKQFFNEKLGEM